MGLVPPLPRCCQPVCPEHGSTAGTQNQSQGQPGLLVRTRPRPRSTPRCQRDTRSPAPAAGIPPALTSVCIPPRLPAPGSSCSWHSWECMAWAVRGVGGGHLGSVCPRGPQGHPAWGWCRCWLRCRSRWPLPVYERPDGKAAWGQVGTQPSLVWLPAATASGIPALLLRWLNVPPAVLLDTRPPCHPNGRGPPHWAGAEPRCWASCRASPLLAQIEGPRWEGDDSVQPPQPQHAPL